MIAVVNEQARRSELIADDKLYRDRALSEMYARDARLLRLAADRLRSAALAEVAAKQDRENAVDTVDQLLKKIDRLEAKLADRLRAPEAGEPVAWLYTPHGDQPFASTVSPHEADAYYTHQPLYTHPSAREAELTAALSRWEGHYAELMKALRYCIAEADMGASRELPAWIASLLAAPGSEKGNG